MQPPPRCRREVTIHALGARRVRAGAFPLLRLVWRLRPGVILSGAPEVSFLVLLLRPLFPPKTRVLVRQNGTVSAALAFGGLPRYTRWLYRLLYRHADRVICQSRAMAEDLARELGIGEEQIAVLPNPVDLEGIRAAPKCSACSGAARARTCWLWEGWRRRKALTCCSKRLPPCAGGFRTPI